MELVDVLDSNGNKLNELVDKDKAHKEGIYHPVVHVVVLSKDKKRILLQKRCGQKKVCPNMWDVAAAGHISSGENSIEAAQREFEEELGLDSREYDFQKIGYFREKYDDRDYIIREYVYLYLIVEDINIKDIIIQKEEVSEVKWITKEQFKNAIESQKIIYHEYYNIINNLMR